MIINIKNTKLTDSIYKKSILLGYVNTYKILKTNKGAYKFSAKHNIYHIKNFYKISNYIYIKYKELINLNKNLKSGVLLISTSIGIITNKKAEFLKLGGVLICYIS